MKPSGIITLLTDFGLSDPYVGVMKGVILQRFAQARLVDLSHQIAAHDVSAAAFWLERSYAWFPVGTVHLVVVDPGVGSERQALVVDAGGHLFVGPDNGVFNRVLMRQPRASVHALEPEVLQVSELSATFHGRDLFAPAAAELAAGRLTSADFLSLSVSQQAAPTPKPDSEGRFVTRVVVVDQFGNLITDFPSSLLDQTRAWHVRMGEQRLGLVRTYADAAPGQCVALFGSFGTLEVAVREGSAAKHLGAAPGAMLVVEPGSD